MIAVAWTSRASGGGVKMRQKTALTARLWQFRAEKRQIPFLPFAFRREGIMGTSWTGRFTGLKCAGFTRERVAKWIGRINKFQG